jgi:sulfite reductase alpha subunit-like flavoprotein
VWELLHYNNAQFFVAGNAKNMPNSVQEALMEVAKKEGQLSEEEAKQFVQNLERNGRYQQETWA